jgi:hypothetical protein
MTAINFPTETEQQMYSLLDFECMSGNRSALTAIQTSLFGLFFNGKFYKSQEGT